MGLWEPKRCFLFENHSKREMMEPEPGVQAHAFHPSVSWAAHGLDLVSPLLHVHCAHSEER